LTAAEAYYASISGPYQLLITGDPLCQPFATPPRFKIAGLQEGEQVGEKTTIEFQPSDDPSSSKPRHISLLLDGQFQGQLGFPSRLNISGQKLKAGAHELRFIGTDETRIESRWEKAVWVLSGPAASQVRFSGPKSWKASDKKPLVVNIVGSNPNSLIEIRHDKVRIETVQNGKNLYEVPVDKLGTGPVRLQAVELVGTTEIPSLPIIVAIE
jgi:hypothetical protein